MGIRYQLPTGKYVYLTLDEALDMDNLENLQDLIANDLGYDSDDPFDDHNDPSADPITYIVPEPDSDTIPDEEKVKIRKDLLDGE